MNYPSPNMLVESDWLESRLDDPDIRVVDCRTNIAISDDGEVLFSSAEPDWLEGHIPGAVHVDIRTQLSDGSNDLPFMLPPADQFASVVSRLGIGAGKRVILYDGFYNIWAARMWWMLRAFGHDDATVLNGGITKWTLEGRPLASGDEAVEAATFEANPRADRFVTKDRVLSGIDDRQTHILDALGAEHFTGDAPFWVHRPGHIPSADNLPYDAIVDHETHAYLPPDRLAQVVASLGLPKDEPVITYCHAGNAASSAAFALALMGHEDVAIYDGSLREWAADASLPMELGAR